MIIQISIIGGGPVGMLLACLLGKGGIETTLIDAKPEKAQLEQDGKVFAIIEGSWDILKYLQVSIPDTLAQPIEGISIARNNQNPMKYNQQNPMGFMVESHVFRKALMEKLKSIKKVNYLTSTRVKDFSQSQEGVEITTHDGKHIKSTLAVASDGQNSFMRKLLNAKTIDHQYKNGALVTTIEHEKYHDGYASEWFFKDTVLATLPMLPTKTNNRSSLVWMDKPEVLEQLKAMNENDFISRLSLKIPDLRAKKILSPMHVYPTLKFSIVKKQIHDRLVFIGDSAHTLHPLTGQAMNLGFRDALALSKVLLEAQSLGVDPKPMLTSYARKRMIDIASISAFIHGIAWSSERKLPSKFMSLMMRIGHKIPIIRKNSMSHATGKGLLLKLAGIEN